MLYLRKENRYLHAICHDSIAIHSLSIHKLLNENLAELPTILDSFVTGYANTTSISIGSGGGGEPWSGGLRVCLNLKQPNKPQQKQPGQLSALISSGDSRLNVQGGPWLNIKRRSEIFTFTVKPLHIMLHFCYLCTMKYL